LVRTQVRQPNKEKKNMVEQDKKQIILTEQETWAGAAKEFFRQFGSVATLLILVLTVGQCTDCVDVYRLLGR
jgi:hypothetical protein